VSASPHLVRRRNTYPFGIAVPRELVAKLGKVEIKTTLKTSDPLTAKQRSRVLSSAIETLFIESKRMPDLARRVVENRIKVNFRDFLEKSYELDELLQDHYDSSSRALKAEIAWAAMNAAISRAFAKPESGRICVKLINHFDDEVQKVFEV
jgi:hypothetical protein